MSTTRKSFTHEELYLRLVENKGKLTLAEIAREYDQRLTAPLLAYYVGQFCHENNKDLPVFTYTRKDQPLVAKLLKRVSTERDIRLSPRRLRASGLDQPLRFKMLGDPNKGLLLLVDASVPANTPEEALRYFYEGKKPTSAPVELEDDEDDAGDGKPVVTALRLPGTGTVSKPSRRKTAN